MKPALPWQILSSLVKRSLPLLWSPSGLFGTLEELRKWQLFEPGLGVVMDRWDSVLSTTCALLPHASRLPAVPRSPGLSPKVLEATCHVLQEQTSISIASNKLWWGLVCEAAYPTWPSLCAGGEDPGWSLTISPGVSPLRTQWSLGEGNTLITHVWAVLFSGSLLCSQGAVPSTSQIND